MKKAKDKQTCSKAFTLIEMVMVVGVLGIIMGGLLFSMRQVIEEGLLLKKMKVVENETQLITDIFAKDAQYSELNGLCGGGSCTTKEGEAGSISFSLTEKEADIQGGGGSTALYNSEEEDGVYYLTREISGGRKTKLNTIPLRDRPRFNVKKMESEVDGKTSYLITISVIFQVDTKYKDVRIPIQTSVVSRLFEIS